MKKPRPKIKLVKTIYCLFHEKEDCECIRPVVERNKLIERLHNAIRLGIITGKDIAEFESRLAIVSNSSIAV